MKTAFFVLLLLSFSAKAQWYYEGYFYPEKTLLANFQNARTPEEEVHAAGVLLLHYKCNANESLAGVYLNKIYSIAAASKQKALMASAIWWDALPRTKVTLYDETALAITKANELLDFAHKNRLPEKEIAANLILSDINLHKNLTLAEKHGLAAKQLLENWKADSTLKDSLKLEVYQVLARVYVYKRDGVHTAQYLLAQQDYAEQNRNLALKIRATHNLADMYMEWPGQQRKTLAWNKKLYGFYRNSSQIDKHLFINLRLATLFIGNRDSAAYYYNAFESLRTKWGVTTLFMIGETFGRLSLQLVTPTQAIDLLNSRFHNQLPAPPAIIDQAKAEVYMLANRLDSAGFYLAKAKENKIELFSDDFDHYAYSMMHYSLKKRDFDAAIRYINEWKKKGEAEGDPTKVQESLELLSKAYEGKNEYKTADAYLKQFYHLKDSLVNLNNNEEVALLQVQKEREIQQASFKEQERMQQMEQARVADRNKMRTYAFVASVLVLLLVAILLWRNNRFKQRSYNSLQEQKAKTDKALQELKSTQAQLIQAEKMASLGELTAGIAHEIQNPLNFVNNFSEVSAEMLAEMNEEISKGNLKDAKELATEVVGNIQKIQQHGKRADAIVKSMLQHSKASGGKAEPADINALCDECLRVSYQSFCAKNKSNGVLLQTDFDNSIGKINVVPMNMGQVLLNLFSNAFYAVQEKAKHTDNFQPVLFVGTKRMSDKIEIAIKDNGTGIPAKLLDKIFQPFFTTKPTGEGTGLGLSLSYDIITKGHGGELKVNSIDGEGATFIIQLPV